MISLSSQPRLLIILLIVILSGCAETKSTDGYEITGTIEGLKDGQVKLMRGNKDRTSTTIDSAEVKDGKFALKGKVESPQIMSLNFEPGTWSMSLFMENSPITIKADTTGSNHYDYTAYGSGKGAILKNYTITGSRNQDLFMQYENDPALKIYEPEFAKLQEEYQAANDDKEKANAVKDRMDSLRTILTGIQKKWIDSFITKNPSAPAGAHLLSNYYMFNEDMPLQDMEAMMGKFTGEAKSTVYYKNLTEDLEQRKSLLPGNVAPDFTLLKPDSTSFTLSSLRGKYVLLDFWASWCVPCRKAIPHWKEVYKQYHDKGFEILGVTNDSRWSDWHKALEEEKMPWLQVADEFPVKNMPSRVGTMYMTPYLPTYILLDKDGKILLHNASKEQIDQKLKEVLAS